MKRLSICVYGQPNGWPQHITGSGLQQGPWVSLWVWVFAREIPLQEATEEWL